MLVVGPHGVISQTFGGDFICRGTVMAGAEMHSFFNFYFFTGVIPILKSKHEAPIRAREGVRGCGSYGRV